MRKLLALCALIISLAFAQDYAPVTSEMLDVNASGQEWLTYRGGSTGWGYSSLNQINADNVSALRPVWTFASGVTNGHEAPPIVHNGIIYATAAYNKLFALDAVSGDLIWSYERRLPRATLSVNCCDVVNRGVALYGDKVYMATLDSAMVALDALSGQVVWETTVGDYTLAEVLTAAPLVADGKVIIGIHGGEFGVRGFIQAMDAESGEILWKTYTVQEAWYDTWEGDSEQTSGAAAWLTGTYDAATRTVYWGAGNPAPWMGPKGDKIGSDTMLALDVDTGELKSYFQRTPDDSWDFDGVNEALLIDLELDGVMRHTAMIADRNGYLYMLDRADGLKFINAHMFSENNIFTGFEADGRPIVDPERKPDIGKQAFACPGFLGGRNWSSMSWSPDTELMYIPSNNWCMNIKGVQTEFVGGQPFVGAEFEMLPVPGFEHVGALVAINPRTGEKVWSVNTAEPIWGGTLATGGNLVFHGDLKRYLNAYNAQTGEKLWSFRTNSGVIGVPSTYEIDGKQYVAVWAGYGGAIPLWGGPIVERVKDVPQGGVLWVFALDDMIRAGSAADVAQGQ
ncbi:MAG: PQQ-dependent dehydrogenase, methanol/ethanol family [Deinococcales bacterium]